ncbi:hypothetical protein PR048_017449 [Dryococelus australis]|uniref:Reverse transcriptase Ty1/copia-type domain-containing protein n=1 Tax=Dryococelus australis TaxID=614101 RepID=A0ABQ9H9Q1_9NEOP|nr:hypothetical protein PR048_017449 [Dryococelus australis]
MLQEKKILTKPLIMKKWGTKMMKNRRMKMNNKVMMKITFIKLIKKKILKITMWKEDILCGFGQEYENLHIKMLSVYFWKEKCQSTMNMPLDIKMLHIGRRRWTRRRILFRRIKHGNCKNLIIFFHVANGMILGSLKSDMDMIKKLGSRFELTCSEVDYYLGLQIKTTASSIEINQSAYAEMVLRKFGMEDCGPLSLPIKPRWTPGNSPLAENVENYCDIIGSLNYLVAVTRPYLANAVSVASRVQDKPTKAHSSLVDRILCYIKGTISEGIKFEKTNNKFIEAYRDADNAGEKTSRISTSGILTEFSGGPVLCRMKLQKCVALSSMEAEYVAASEAAKSLVWLDRLLKEVNAIFEESFPKLMIDNQSTIKLI